jgi:hypothetical protein
LHTLHATHSRARTADELQFTLQEGPTVDVVRHRRQVLADTISTDPRYGRSQCFRRPDSYSPCT